MQTFLSTDDLVDDVMRELSSQRLLNLTYAIYTSDHGFHLGQFRMPEGKKLPYETDIRIPFLIR